MESRTGTGPRPTAATASIALLALFVGCQPAEWRRSSRAAVPSVWADDWRVTRTLVFRVVDERGNPIAGAEAIATYEDEHPRGGGFWDCGRATADDDGLVRLRFERKCDLVVVRASGHADAAEVPGEADPIVLRRALPVPIRVVDWLGRPAVGEIGYTRFCGHRPDLEVARIGTDGIAWLQRLGDFQPEVYARAAGLGAEYDSCGLPAAWRPGLPPPLFRLHASSAVIGTLVDTSGGPMPGVPIGGASQHRGPWTVTDAAGRFRLEHLPPDDMLVIDVENERRWLPAPPRSRPCTLRLADAKRIGDADRFGSVRLRCVRADGTPVPASRIEVRYMGRTKIEDDGVGILVEHLQPGEHAIAVDGPLSEFEGDEVAVTVRADAVVDCVVTVRERPRVRFVVRGGGAQRVSLVGPTWSVDVTDRAGQPIPVPCDGLAAF